MDGLLDDDVNTSTGTWSNDSCGNQKTQQLTAEQQQQQQQEVNNGSGQPAALTPSQQAVAAASNRSISGSGSKNSSGQLWNLSQLGLVPTIFFSDIYPISFWKYLELGKFNLVCILFLLYV